MVDEEKRKQDPKVNKQYLLRQISTESNISLVTVLIQDILAYEENNLVINLECAYYKKFVLLEKLSGLNMKSLFVLVSFMFK